MQKLRTAATPGFHFLVGVKVKENYGGWAAAAELADPAALSGPALARG
jgi:hypothetical protein